MASAAEAATWGAGSTAASVSLDAGSLDALSLVAAALQGFQGQYVPLHLQATFSIPDMQIAGAEKPIYLPAFRVLGFVAPLLVLLALLAVLALGFLVALFGLAASVLTPEHLSQSTQITYDEAAGVAKSSARLVG